jgi:hypothetical protein
MNLKNMGQSHAFADSNPEKCNNNTELTKREIEVLQLVSMG